MIRELFVPRWENPCWATAGVGYADRSVGIDNEQVALVVLGYPQLGPGNLECIEGFRNDHDMLYRGVGNAHFTLVFRPRRCPRMLSLLMCVRAR